MQGLLANDETDVEKYRALIEGAMKLQDQHAKEEKVYQPDTTASG